MQLVDVAPEHLNPLAMRKVVFVISYSKIKTMRATSFFKSNLKTNKRSIFMVKQNTLLF